MTSRRLDKIQRELEAMRRRLGSIRPSELVSVARSLGRAEANRGKEPTYVRQGWFPLSIPNHPGTLATGTAGSIVNTLLDDVEALRGEVEEQEALRAEIEEQLQEEAQKVEKNETEETVTEQDDEDG